MEILNNREIATLLWFAALMTWAMWKAKAWPALRGVVTSFCKPIILRSITLMAAYVAATVWLLANFDLWELANLKTTIVWFGTFVLGWMFNLNRWDADPNENVRATLAELLSVTVFVTFLTEFYTFNLIGELVLVPVAAFIALMGAVSEHKPETARVAKLAKFLLGVIGWGLILHAAYRVVGDFRGFATVETGREFAVPGLLSLLFIPFMYVFNVYVAYETTFRVLPRRMAEGGVGRYAFWRAVMSFGLNVKLMRRWKAALFNRDAITRRDVDQLIATMKAARRRERKPPLVKPEEGWSPHAATGWLQGHGLGTSGYNPIYGGEWGASSPYRKLGGGVLGDSLTYYVRGTAEAATKLTLMLNLDRLRKEETPQASLDTFSDALFALLFGAFGDKAPRVARGLKNKKRRTQQDRVTVALTEGDSTIKLVITHPAHVEAY